MSETSTVLLALLAGHLAWRLFFGGLWWTIRRASRPRPAALVPGSLLLRTTIAVAGFYFVSRGDWRKLLACLLGFLIARFLVTRFTRRPRSEEPEGRRGAP
jgi:F1F0 ATPase subunit 2